MTSISSFKEEGSATILTLLISAVMITVGIGFNWIVKEHLMASEGLKAKAEAMAEARSIFDTLMYSMLTGEVARSEVILAEGEVFFGAGNIPLGRKSVNLKGNMSLNVRDSNGLMSIVSMNTDAFRRLLKMSGAEERNIDTIIDSYIDWIDIDDLSRINGAEAAYYRTESKPYKPGNLPVQYLEELSFIKGMTPELLKKMEPHLTMLPSTGFNPNTAGDEVLAARLDLSRETLEALKAYMAGSPLTSDAELFRIAGRMLVHGGGEDVYYYPSRFFDITIKAGSPMTVYTLNVGIDMRPKLYYPYSVIYWKEG